MVTLKKFGHKIALQSLNLSLILHNLLKMNKMKNLKTIICKKKLDNLVSVSINLTVEKFDTLASNQTQQALEDKPDTSINSANSKSQTMKQEIINPLVTPKSSRSKKVSKMTMVSDLPGSSISSDSINSKKNTSYSNFRNKNEKCEEFDANYSGIETEFRKPPKKGIKRFFANLFFRIK
jgi:hypothetical protein